MTDRPTDPSGSAPAGDDEPTDAGLADDEPTDDEPTDAGPATPAGHDPTDPTDPTSDYGRTDKVRGGGQAGASPGEGPDDTVPAGHPSPDPGPGPHTGADPGPGAQAGTEPLAGRYGLVRPKQGRHVAGVCAAIGRATGTDPVLWRALLAVLICFMGVGVLVYLLLWLVTPEEGDTGSPAEALLGKGRSSTSAGVAVVLGVISVALLAAVLPRPTYLFLLIGVVVLGVLLWTQRQGDRGTGGATPGPPAPPPQAPPAPPPQAPPPGVSPQAPPPGPPGQPAHPGSPREDVDEPGRAAPTGPGSAPAAVAAAPGGAPGTDPTGGPGSGPPPPAQGGYRPPLAPHGPFAGPPSRPPRPPRERSPLAAITFFAALAAVGMVGMLDQLGVPVPDMPATAYVATALAVTGAGLLVGAWWGRARLLIPLGLLLSLVLVVVQVVHLWDPGRPVVTTWTPDTVAELDDSYTVTFGEGRLDLREVDFTDRRTELAVTADGAQITVLLPPDVEVSTHTEVLAGAITMSGDHAGAPPAGSQPTATVTPTDDDVELVLHLRANFGYIEVIQ